jgi:hypothetical protein
MFLLILYDVFHPFLSMLPIVHVQSIYNLIKPVTTCCMIFVDFPWFFWHCKHQNRSLVNQQNRSVYRTSVWFTDLFQTFHQFEFCISFWPVLSVFGETVKTSPIWFSHLCRFPAPMHHYGSSTACFVFLFLFLEGRGFTGYLLNCVISPSFSFWLFVGKRRQCNFFQNCW